MKIGFTRNAYSQCRSTQFLFFHPETVCPGNTKTGGGAEDVRVTCRSGRDCKGTIHNDTSRLFIGAFLGLVSVLLVLILENNL